MKGCIRPFPKKDDLGLAKKYRGITLTSIAAEIYNAPLGNYIEPKIDNILRKKENGVRRRTPKKTNRRQYYLLTLRRPLIPFTEGRWNKFY